MTDRTFPAMWESPPADIAGLRERHELFLRVEGGGRISYGDAPDEIRGDNNRRASRAAGAVVYAADHLVATEPGAADGENVDTVIGDLLGDLMHLCDALSVDWDVLVARAERDHHAELRGIL